jgi:predicted N-acetyltransferase YhbS
MKTPGKGRTSPTKKWPDLRPIQARDWPGIDHVQRACFPASAVESTATLRSIADAAPEMCAVAEDDGGVIGYLLAHPWKPEHLPPLNEPLAGLPDDASCAFIHDMALLPSARGSGFAGRMVQCILAIAAQKGMTSASLLSVQGTVEFWTRFGFVERPELTKQFHDHVFGFYEIDFHFMTARLG